MSAPATPAFGSFSSEQQAREHLCDHVLTRPESHDWSLILPGYATLVSPEDDAALTVVAASLFSPAPAAEGVELLKGYIASIHQAIEDAVRLGWWWEEPSGNYPAWHGLGLTGVYVVWDRRVIRTGHLRRSSQLALATPSPDRLKNPLPRRRYDKRLPAVPADADEERYLLFYENLWLIQKVYENACDKNGVRDYGSKVFMTRPPRPGKLTQLLAERPAPARSEEPPP